MTEADRITTARALAQSVIPEDITDAAPQDDLRDHGLDSIRAMDLLEKIESRGGDVEFTDFMTTPTLMTIAGALKGVGTKGS